MKHSNGVTSNCNAGILLVKPDIGRWSTFFAGTDAILFVVDAADRARIEEARRELFRVLEDESTKNCCICVLANKMDLPNSLSQQEVTSSLQLTEISKDHAWGIFPTCAFTGQGLNEVVNWLVQHLSEPTQ